MVQGLPVQAALFRFTDPPVANIQLRDFIRHDDNYKVSITTGPAICQGN
jgi:hypothetical protein